ncbi:MAG: 2-oxoglutarate synthase subunit alpha [Desulfurococcales archaeon ex4484_58]|nr:MAG: 2-oxoglutarate synthase subunit alpha [Desulfurococcales archaeon ex4484_58]
MKRVYTHGNRAIAEAALVAGLKFYAGYPITPTSDIMEYLAEKLPEYGGVMMQFEDELASINAIVGASWAGAKAMTATSGPGFSLMAEGLGLAVITETPIVIAYVMRAGPSTGVPTKSTQADIYQARFVSHGDYIIPVLAPWSVQEAFDLTIKAFNIAEYLRTPVILLSDATLAHLWESAVFRDRGEVEIIDRKKPKVPPEKYKPYEPEEDGIAPMAVFGEGYKVLVESLTHDERGFYIQDTMVQRRMVQRIVGKIIKNIDRVFEYETHYMDNARHAIVSYGTSARSSLAVVRDLREKGIDIGMVRLKTIWPIDEGSLRKTLSGVEKIFVVENNMGKLVWDIQRIMHDKEVIPVSIIDLDLPSPNEILEVINEWL